MSELPDESEITPPTEYADEPEQGESQDDGE